MIGLCGIKGQLARLTCIHSRWELRQMKRHVMFAVLFLALAIPAAAAARPIPQSPQPASTSTPQATPEAAMSTHPNNADSIVVPDGTPFRIKLAEGYSSATASVGDTIKYAVVDSVWEDGIAVIPQGMAITGKVVAVSRPRRGHNGEVKIALGKFSLPTGEAATMRAILRPRTAGEKTKEGMEAAGDITAITFMFPMVIAAAPVTLFMKGDELVVPAGGITVMYLNGPLRVSREAAAKQEPAPDSGLAHIFYRDDRIGIGRTLSLFCGQKSLGPAYGNEVHRINLKPGTYRFSMEKGNEKAVKMEVLENREYYLKREHRGLIVKDFQENQASLYNRKYRFVDQDLSKLPENELKLLSAEPITKSRH